MYTQKIAPFSLNICFAGSLMYANTRTILCNTHVSLSNAVFNIALSNAAYFQYSHILYLRPNTARICIQQKPPKKY